MTNGYTPTLRQVVGANIQVRRAARRITQDQLAEMVGGFLETKWHKQTVSAVERGARGLDLDELVAVGWALGATLDHLLFAAWQGDPLPLESNVHIGREETNGVRTGSEVQVEDLRTFFFAGRQAATEALSWASQRAVAGGLAQTASSVSLTPPQADEEGAES
jgi:transcriptional regulator with XRE-family HTH domain